MKNLAVEKEWQGQRGFYLFVQFCYIVNEIPIVIISGSDEQPTGSRVRTLGADPAFVRATYRQVLTSTNGFLTANETRMVTGDVVPVETTNLLQRPVVRFK
jgi:hypothetical protein